MKKIYVAIPANLPFLYLKFVETLIPLLLPKKAKELLGYDAQIISYGFGKRYPIDCNRDDLIMSAFKTDFTHLLFLDADQIFPYHLIEGLISMNTDIASALYFRKMQPHTPIPCHAVLKSDNPYMYESLHMPDPPGPVECDATGMGACLIRREVFEAIEPPWFEYGMSPEEPMRAISEDMAFCKKAKRAGFKIMVDTRVIIGHLTIASIGLPHYQAGQNLLKSREQMWIDCEPLWSLLNIWGHIETNQQRIERLEKIYQDAT